jgi:hypothetical protein
MFTGNNTRIIRYRRSAVAEHELKRIQTHGAQAHGHKDSGIRYQALEGSSPVAIIFNLLLYSSSSYLN